MQCYSQCYREQSDDCAYVKENVAHLSHIHLQTRQSFCPVKAVSDPLVHSSPTLLCPAERTLNPLSSRWKPKGNSSPTGNIRTKTQPLHLLASRPLCTLVPRGPGSEQDVGWEDRGVDWFYPAWQSIQVPNLPPALLLFLSHGRLNHSFVCWNRLLKPSSLSILFSC